MKIRAQIGMVLNLDKCIGCHTCSVTCKNVWTSRPGMEYAWFNNVETKPGIGYPKEWENQDKWNGGWIRKRNGVIEPRQGAKWKLLMRIFANPNLPEIDDYYEPFSQVRVKTQHARQHPLDVAIQNCHPFTKAKPWSACFCTAATTMPTPSSLTTTRVTICIALYVMVERARRQVALRCLNDFYCRN